MGTEITQTKKTVTSVIILWCVFSCSLIAEEQNNGAKYFVQKSTWAESMLASREVYLQNCTESIVAVGPWYITGVLQAREFADVFFPEKGIDLKAKDENGKALWTKKPEWHDGEEQELDGGSNAMTYLYRTIKSDKATTVTVVFSCNDGIELWLNGKKLMSHKRHYEKGNLDLPLIAGTNKLLMKVHNISSYCGFNFEVIQNLAALELWDAIKEKYSVQCYRMLHELGGNWHIKWFSNTTGLDIEKKMMESVLGDLGIAGKQLKKEYDLLNKQKVAGKDCRWLNLYTKGCSHRVDLEKLNKMIKLWEQQYQQIDTEIKMYSDKVTVESSSIMDRQALILPTDRCPVGVVIRRTIALLGHLRTLADTAVLNEFEQKLNDIKAQYASGNYAKKNAAAHKSLYIEVCKLRREIALSNPLLDFDEMIFITKSGNREGVLQCWNYGYHVNVGGGLYKVSGLKSGQRKIHDILENSVVQSGRLKGEKLSGRGAFNLPTLDYDGKTIVFSFVEKSGIEEHFPRDIELGFTEKTCFHLFKVNADGSGLVRLTDGDRNDYHPCFLPNGRIVFVSDRRNVMDRCQGGRPGRGFAQPCGTMYSINPDGTDLICISYHETTELNPSVDNNGMLVYTRWDYVDRDFSAAHNFWRCYPDGRDPRAPHGNYPYPHDTSKGTWKDGRSDRPWAEYCIKAIPGSARYIAVASHHHISGPYGTLILIDTRVEDDNKMSQVTRFNNFALPDEGGANKLDDGDPSDVYHGDMDQGLPPYERNNQEITDVPGYMDPWPLSEDYVIAAQDNGVYLLDKFGNKVILFSVSKSDCNGIDSIRCPIPLKAQKAPPVLPTGTYQGQRADHPDHKKAVVSIMNVYEADFDWPGNTVIKSLRVLQLFPYPWHSPFQDSPRIGPGDGVSARAVLGVVPVESDGSVYFEAPINKAIYFQALDQNGMAVQSMRSCTYIHPGEHLTCVGCHENKWKAPLRKSTPIALQRPPSKLIPNLEDGSCPLTYARLVKPVLAGKCIPCHQKHNKPKPDLMKYRFYFHGTGWSRGLEPNHGGYRTIAGKFGALHTGIADILLKKHHRDALSMEEINRITLWIDANSNELGAYRDEEKQRAGEVVWPTIDMDPANPAGLDLITDKSHSTIPAGGPSGQR